MIATVPAPFALVRWYPGGKLFAVTNMGYPVAADYAMRAEALGFLHQSGPDSWLPTWLGMLASQPALATALAMSMN